ncbi:MAG: hypothetical protein KAU95_02910, partial [Candidatus Aenigmarchaeota archaeon]|nr:hypothetical protein [Candidatus Aenigmarchaeota archaeon]
MRYTIILLSFLIFFSFQEVAFADNTTIIIKPPDLVLESSPLYLLPPIKSSWEFKLKNPQEFDENLLNISFANFKFSGVHLPTLISFNESKTFSCNLSFEERKDPDFYFYEYENIKNIINYGTRLIVKGNFFGATIDYAYLPPNPRTKILDKVLSLIHTCNSSYHPSQLINASGSLYICSDNCSTVYEWRDAYYPKVNSISAFRKIVDGTKEAGITSSPVVVSFVSDKNCYQDIYKVYLTAISPNGTKVVEDVEMSCSHYNFTTKKCVYELTNCAELGNYTCEVRVVDNEGLEGRKSEPNIFRTIDLQVSITNFYGNTTDFYLEGKAKILPENLDITNVLNLCYCGYPNPLYLGGNVEKCGILNNCTYLGPGKFKCYIRDLRLTDVLTNISFIITTNAFSINLSGYDRKEIDISGAINSVELSQRKLFLNIFEPINYTINISNYGNIGWHGEIYNQTRNSICSFRDGNPDREHCSVKYNDKNSFINLQKGKTKKFNYIGYYSHILGTYKNHSMN